MIRPSGLRLLPLAVVSALFLGACGGSETPTPPTTTSLSPEQAAELVALQNRGIGLLERYEYVAAVEPLRKAHEMAPGWSPGRIHLALALMNVQADSTPEALKLLYATLEDEPKNARAAFLAAVLEDNSGNTETARDLFKVAYEESGDAVAGAKYGTVLSLLDQDEEARAVLEAVHARHPMLVSPVNALMLLHARAGRQDESKAYQAKLKALGQSPNPEVAQSKLGDNIDPAYGGMGPLSMCDRSFLPPADVAATPTVDVTATPLDVKLDWTAGALPAGTAPFLGAAVFDLDDDRDLDLFLCGGDGPAALLRNDGPDANGVPRFTNIAEAAGVALSGVYAAAAGELDVGVQPQRGPRKRIETRIDLVLLTTGGVKLLFNQGDGTFEDATEASGLSADPGGARAVLVADLDQEGDLDIFLSGGEGGTNRLWANRGPGRFENATADSGLAGDGGVYGPAVVLDVDGDLDLDLLVSRPGAAPTLFANDRLLRFHAPDLSLPSGIDSTYGVLTGDFDEDGHEDAIAAGASGATWLRGDGAGFLPHALENAPGGPVIDVDAGLRGERDLVFSSGQRLTRSGPVFAEAGTLFEARDHQLAFAADLDGSGAEELVLLAPGQAPRFLRVTGEGQGGAVLLDFQGVIRTDQAGWSNLEGRGALVEVRAGATWQQRRVGGTGAYGVAIPTRQVFGVGPAPHADFVRMLWPDGVQQAALDIPVGAPHLVVEEQLRPDSCPLIFTWNGERFVFVADFLGAGGLGFLLAPGVYAQPDPTETVKVPDGMLVPDDEGLLQVRLPEAMEETCYLDEVELLIVDHPAGVDVYPDERFTGAPPFADGGLVPSLGRIEAVAARNEAGDDVLAAVSHVDRRYHEDHLSLHPRLLGATGANVLELDFGDRLAEFGPDAPLTLHAYGWIEYGYTRTSVAAVGEGFTYVPPALDVWNPDTSAWETVAEDLGFPAGFPRTMTYDLTGKVHGARPRFRLRTNFEVYWDKVWIAPRTDATSMTVSRLRADTAELRWLGYPREFSPDGRHPRIYDYGTLDQAMPWKTVEGDYTRFGDVRPLLGAADDRYVIYGKGEEVSLTFATSGLPPLADGAKRSYFLRFVGWCKGQELYTAHGFTVEPLPFLGMTNYPYVDGETYPESPELEAYRREWNTRRVKGATRKR